MATEMGEYLAGAHLKLVLECDVVDYNVRPPGGGVQGLEIDVVGFNLREKIAYLCEVATHVKGLNYGSGNHDSIKRIQAKFDKQQPYAQTFLPGFTCTFMLWSPNVPKGYLEHRFEEIDGLEVVANRGYRIAVEELKKKARQETHPTENPAFRLLQILAAMRD